MSLPRGTRSLHQSKALPKQKHRRKMLTVKIRIHMDADAFDGLTLDEQAKVVAHEFMHRSLINDVPTNSTNSTNPTSEK